MSSFRDYNDRIWDVHQMNLTQDWRDYQEQLEVQEEIEFRLPRKIVKDRQNPLESMRDADFR